MGDTYHVMPVDDLVEHETNDSCVCVPTPDPVKRDDGSMGWVIIHHSLDGREIEERRAELERQRWENFATVRRVQWCKCREDSHAHVWLPSTAWGATDHDRVPPSLNFELHQFREDALFCRILPPTPHTVRTGQ